MEDEDVDLEHTELYRYSRWAESGLTNDGSLESASKSKGERQKWRFRESVGQFLRLISPWNYPSSSGNIEAFHDEFYRTIVGCGILVEEDALFLEAVMPDDSGFGNSCSSSSPSPLSRLFFPLLPAVALSSASVFVPAVSERYFRLPSGVGYAMVATGVAGLNLLAASMLLRRWRRRRRLLTRLRDFVATSEGFVRLARKCLRFMQELEVIGRGLLLVTPLSSADRLSNSNLLPSTSPLPSACRCLGLRQSLSEEMMKQFRLMRDTTVLLINLCPLRKDVDDPAHYIAFSSEHDLLSSSKQEDNDVCLSENIGIAATRSVCQLYSVQLSEFMRRLGSCFVLEFACPDSDPDIRNESAVLALTPLLERLSARLVNSTETLTEAYRFQRLITFGRNRSSPERCSKNDTTCADASDTYKTAVRSLSLHLQVGLARVQDLMDKFPDFKLNGEQVVTEVPPPTDVTSFCEEQFRAIRHDLDSCRDCLEESELRFRKIFNVRDPVSSLTDEHSVNSLPVVNTCTIIPLTGKTDMAPADQIFEAYVDFSDTAIDSVEGSWDTVASIKSREAREVANRMYRELKVALVPKAEEWQEREAKAMGVSPTKSKISEQGSCDGTETISLGAEKWSNSTSDHFMMEENVSLSNSRSNQSLSGDSLTETTVVAVKLVNVVPNSSLDMVHKFTGNEPISTSSLTFPASIAATAAARGRIFNAQSIRDSDIYIIGGEEHFGSDDEDSSFGESECG